MRLLERDAELAVIDAVVSAAAAGGARVLLLEGPAGIGKTRLLAEARRRAADAGFRPLSARGSELERGFPFGVVRQLLEPDLRVRDDRVFTGAAAAARDVFDPIPGSADGPGSTDPSFASLHGLYWLVADLAADAPIALFLDDLHWCDSPSLRFLAYLVRRLEGLPVLVAATLRPAERAADVAVLGELAGDPSAVSVRPRALGESATADLLRDRLGGEVAPAFATACRAATGGNPLLLHELARALAAEGVRPDAAHVRMVSDLGPRAATRSVLVRLARLPEAAVRMARAAAVLGDGASLADAADFAGLDDQQAAAGADALVRAEILRAQPTVGFVHPLVGQAVYADITPVEQSLAHQRAARLLVRRAAPVEQVAVHLLAAPTRSDPDVVDTLVRAARGALRKGAPDAAVDYLGRALAEPPPAERRVEVLSELGRAEVLTQGPGAIEHLRAAYDQAPDPLDRAAVAQLLARALLFTGSPVDGAELARRAGAGLPPGHDDLRAALEAFELMAVFFGAGDPTLWQRLVPHRALPVPDGLGARMLAAVAAQEWAYAGGPSTACAELSRQALAGGALQVADFELFGVTALTTLVLADREEAVDLWDGALADAHRRGSLFAKVATSLWRGFSLYRRGELADAEQSLTGGLEEFAAWSVGEDGTPYVYGAAFLSAVRRERGDLPDARRALERFPDPGDGSESARYRSHSLLELLIAEGRLAEALAVADDAAVRFAYLRNPVDTSWRSPKAIALDGLGRPAEALALLADELELARAWGAPSMLAGTLRVLGTLEREAGLPHLQEAAEIAADSPARLEHAKALYALGSAQRRSARPKDARQALRRAVELAEACAAHGLAERARTELYAAGGRARNTTLTGPGSLTASERRVALLAAQGTTNRDIAQALFVTPKTVELHLSNVYRKLGIPSRRHLSPLLLAPG